MITGNKTRTSVLRVLPVITLLAMAVNAQDPLKVAPQAYKLAFENEWLRVIRVRYAPNEKLPTHNHPKRQSIFVYLNDGGPVRFKHVEGDSGNFQAVRPETKAGAFRLARGLSENHEVENLSDKPSEFLQVELKIEKAEMDKFRGRLYPEQREAGNYRKVEFDNAQLRITRLVCAGGGKCDALEPSAYPGLLVAISPVQFRVASKKGRTSNLRLKTGEVKWLEPDSRGQWQNQVKTDAESLFIELKTKPVADSEAKPHSHNDK